MAVTPFEFPRFSESLKCRNSQEIRVRAVVVDFSNNFLLTLQDILNPDLSFMFGKMHVIR